MIRAVALAVVALAVSVPGASASEPWDLDADTQVLQHTPSGLRFPPNVGGLGRQQHSSGQNPYTPEAASVSYGTPQKSGLLITLMPVAESAETTAEKLFAARTRLFRNQHPNAVPADLSPVISSCARTDSATHLAWFDLPSGRESFYATAISNHVVYVRATEPLPTGDVRNRVALVGFLNEMGWPCSASAR